MYRSAERQEYFGDLRANSLAAASRAIQPSDIKASPISDPNTATRGHLSLGINKTW